jgi:hypothetical protein
MSLPRRIVVMLGGHGDVDAALEAAAMLAGATGAHLAGLFVEDQELFDLAGLPLAATGSGRTGPLTMDLMEKALRSQARTCRRLMADLAGRAHLAFEFETVRGDRRALMAEATLAGDIVLCQTSLGGPGADEVIAHARHNVRAAAGVALIGPLARLRPGPVVAIDDGDETGRHTVTLAARIAARRHETLIVVALANERQSAEATIERARAIAGRGIAMAARMVLGDGTARLAEALIEVQPCCVVADLEGRPFVDDAAVALLVRAARAPLILLRRPTR